jgi:DNA-binding transcriptional LysR family regulator
VEGGQYSELMAFMAIYETRSFRDAALRIGVTPSALSRTLRRLEDRVAVRLFNRTTRSVSPTETGARLFAKLGPAVTGLDQAIEDALALGDDPIGTIRLNLPRLAAELIIVPRLPRFAAQHPNIKVEMVVDDGLTDVVAKGFDAGIRIGERLAQDMIAIRLTEQYRIAVVGSPAYFSRYPPPLSPRDLSDHLCLNYRWATTGQLARWAFDGPEGRFKVDVAGPLVVNDTDLLRTAAIAGMGLVYLPEAAVEPHLASGALVRVLEEWCEPFPGFYLYHPSRHRTPPPLRALISFLQAESGGTE